MYRLAHEKKNYGFTSNLDFNPLSTRFNLAEFLPTQACIQRVCSTSREKRTSKYDISGLNIREGMHVWQLCSYM